MVKLDFSGIDKIAYQGFEDHEERDNIIEQGFTVVPESENPFNKQNEADTARQPEPTAKYTTSSEKPLNRPKKPFMDASGKRDYKTLYRVAYEYHERHNPPTIDRAYWKDHKPEEDEAPQAEVDYWIEAAKDIAEIGKAYGGDPFLTGLLSAVYEELEREYKLCI